MRVKLPRDLAGTKLDELFVVEMNDFDVEMLLPALFWLVRSGGRDRATRTDTKDIIGRTTALAGHPKLKGFLDESGIRLLDKWVRTSIIETSTVGRAHKAEQIAYIRPLSFLSYKPSFPAQTSRMRQVHHFLYGLLTTLLTRDPRDRGVVQGIFDALITRTFARGVELGQGASKDGRYDGHTPLDLEVLLQLYYLDGFDAPRESNRSARPPAPPACAFAAQSLAWDIAGFLTVYSGRVPPQILARYLICLLNFELLIYTLRLMKATNTLVVQGEVPPEFDPRSQELTPLELYVDLTQIRGSRSDTLANECVNRHLEEMENFFHSVLKLRTLNRYVEGNRDLKREIGPKVGGEYLTTLWGLREHPDIRADARSDEREIEKLFRGEGDDDTSLPLDVQAILEHPDLDVLSRVSELLVLLQRKSGLRNILKWYGDVGGLRRSDGILRGNERGRRVWRYVLSDLLLETLVQLAVLSPEAQRQSGDPRPAPEPRSITLAAFLTFLQERFGILIDTPPSFDHSVEATAAAKDNFTALKQRLRQMGLFLDLSDDFNAQRIFPRFHSDLPEDARPTATESTTLQHS